MAEEKVEVRDVNFRQVLPWTELFRSFQVALDPKKLLLAAVGIFAMAFGWWLLAVIFYSSQDRPKWESPPYSVQENYKPSNAGQLNPEKLREKRDEEAWKAFKDDRRKWNLLHDAAGHTREYTDAGDLADSPSEYTLLKRVIEENERVHKEKPGDRRFSLNVEGKTYEVTREPLSSDRTQLTFGGKAYVLAAKPYGQLRTWPWFENRGPNPYLLVTGQTDKPWDTGRFTQWLLFEESLVLIEPLRKFLYPVIGLLYPKAGGLNRFYFLLVTLWTLGVWALIGGAITRMASVQVARNDKVGLRESIRFVTSRYLSFFSAPIFPLLFVMFMVVLLCVYGLFFMIPWFGDVIVAGLGWPLVLLAGLAMAVVLVGLIGWPMMYATISTEGSDSFDAISRSYSYVYQSPWHYLWYSTVALGYGAVVVFFVGFMGSLVVYLGKWGVASTPFIESADREPAFLFVYAPTSFGWRDLLLSGASVNGQPLVVNGHVDEAALEAYKTSFGPLNYAGAGMVSAWLYLFFLLVLGFGYSYFWTASTIIYLLMRRKVDDTDMDEVYLEEDETEESYSASTTMPAPSAPPAAAGSSLQMVDAPSLRSSAPPAPSSTGAVTAPASTEASTATAGGDGNQGSPPAADGEKPT